MKDDGRSAGEMRASKVIRLASRHGNVRAYVSETPRTNERRNKQEDALVRLHLEKEMRYSRTQKAMTKLIKLHHRYSRVVPSFYSSLITRWVTQEHQRLATRNSDTTSNEKENNEIYTLDQSSNLLHLLLLISSSSFVCSFNGLHGHVVKHNTAY